MTTLADLADRSSPFADLLWLALAVGNSRARLGLLRGPDVIEAASLDPADRPAASAAARALVERAAPGGAVSLIAMSSVNPPADEGLLAAVGEAAPAADRYRVGRDLPIPLHHRLEDASTLGQDRALDAIAAFEHAQQACVVVDAGTAITIDFVDGEGTLAGGAIAPGLTLALRSLHEHTAQLPRLSYELPDESRGPFGLDTAHALRLGVTAMARGLLRELLDRYAEAYGGYPQVIVTGGDAGVFEATGLVDRAVPDLQLLGIAVCLRRAFEEDEPASGKTP